MPPIATTYHQYPTLKKNQGSQVSNPSIFVDPSSTVFLTTHLNYQPDQKEWFPDPMEVSILLANFSKPKQMVQNQSPQIPFRSNLDSISIPFASFDFHGFRHLHSMHGAEKPISRRTSWQIIRDKGLLTEAEIRRVSDFPGTVSPGPGRWTGMWLALDGRFLENFGGCLKKGSL